MLNYSSKRKKDRQTVDRNDGHKSCVIEQVLVAQLHLNTNAIIVFLPVFTQLLQFFNLGMFVICQLISALT